MDSQFQRILRLAKRTGDRLIVTDPDGEEPIVILGFDAYEALLNEEDRSPSPSASWSPEMEGDLTPFDDVDPLDAAPVMEDAQAEASVSMPQDIREAVEQDLKIIESWQKEQQAGEKKDQSKGKFDPDEERFYLEPIE